LYAFSKHEEQTLVRSEQANAREEKKISWKEKKKGNTTTEKEARHVVFLLIIQLILSFCVGIFFPFLAVEMDLGYPLSSIFSFYT
jgi:hypothetical protein